MTRMGIFSTTEGENSRARLAPFVIGWNLRVVFRLSISFIRVVPLVDDKEQETKGKGKSAEEPIAAEPSKEETLPGSSFRDSDLGTTSLAGSLAGSSLDASALGGS
jgi:hypothetical protein